MNFRRTQPDTIGLYRGASRCCLVKLAREAGQWTLTAEHVTETTDEVGAFASLFERLDRRADEATLGLAIDGAHGLYRRIHLPPAERDETGHLIAAQVETMVPGQLDQVRWSWTRSASSGPTVAFVSTLQQLEQATQALPEGVIADVAIPEPFALDALITATAQAEQPSRLAVVAVYAHHSQLMIYDDNGLALVETIDTGCSTHESGVQQWVQALADLVEQSVQGWSSEQRPARLLCLASDVDVAPLRDGLGTRLGLIPMTWRDLCAIKGLADGRLEVLIATGAAITAADPYNTRNLLDDPQRAATAHRLPKRTAWIAAAVWLIVALAGLYAITLSNAERYEFAIADSEINPARIATLDRSVNLARYLETQGPAFIAILDEIGQVTQKNMLDEIRYDREGQITISGTLGSADALNRFAGHLAGMKTIDSVQIRNQATFERNKVKYTLVARPATEYFGGFVQPPAPPQKDPPPSDAAPASSESESPPASTPSKAVAPSKVPADSPEKPGKETSTQPDTQPERKQPS